MTFKLLAVPQGRLIFGGEKKLLLLAHCLDSGAKAFVFKFEIIGHAVTSANIGASPTMRFRAISTYFTLRSIRIAFLCRRSATRPVVPAPPNGSNTMPPVGQPALMQRSTSSVGKVAK